MAGTITTSGSNMTATFAYTGTVTTISNILLDAAHEIFTRQGGTAEEFAGLSNAQKLALIDDYIAKAVIGLARQHHVDAAGQAAVQMAITEAATRYMIG